MTLTLMSRKNGWKFNAQLTDIYDFLNLGVTQSGFLPHHIHWLLIVLEWKTGVERPGLQRAFMTIAGRQKVEIIQTSSVCPIILLIILNKKCRTRNVIPQGLYPWQSSYTTQISLTIMALHTFQSSVGPITMQF